MATSENDIRTGVAILLARHGQLNTTQVKQLLDTVIPFDADDRQASNSRNEQKIIQRIGNIVSHQQETIKSYCDNTYQIDKSQSPATWTLLNGLRSNHSISAITPEEIEKRKLKSQKVAPRKIDWEQVNNRRTIIGRLGEEYVIRFETNRVNEFAPEDTGRIIHLSEEQGDGAGFDIISLNESGSKRYIEVKTTQGASDCAFYMSHNEYEYFRENYLDDDLWIYRVYNFNEQNMSGNIKMISALELLENYHFDPTSYRVYRR